MKKKVLIVDDDVNFRYAIRELIPWEENGFEVAGEAIHGQQALGLLEQGDFQVVLTDMEMPILNGVELTRQIKERFPDILVIAMSAFDDFSFVKESMRLGAADYLLKQDFDPQQTVELILKYQKEQDQERLGSLNRTNAKESLLRYLKGEQPKLTERDFLSAFSGRTDLAVFIIECGQDEGPVFVQAGMQMDLLFYARLSPFRWVFLVGIRGPFSGKRRHEAYQGILQELRSLFQEKIRIGYADFETDAEGLAQSFSQSVAALDYRLYFPKQKVFAYPDFRQCEQTRERRYLYVAQDVGSDLDAALSAFRECMYRKMPEKEMLRRSFMVLLLAYLERQGVRTEEKRMLAFFDSLENCPSMQEMEDRFLDCARELLESKKNQYRGAHSEIRKALDYIDAHYQEDISLGSLAEYTGLSENYFSNLFKKETGVALKTYLNEFRIEKAKLLLKDSSRKVYEVAELVGYHNATYFMTIFKKLTGESVSDFRGRL